MCPILPLEHDLEQHSHGVGGDNGNYDAKDVSERFADGLDYTGVGSIKQASTVQNASYYLRHQGEVPFLRKRADKKTREIFRKACSKALGGGITGAIAGIIQVLSLMWLVRSLLLRSFFRFAQLN